MFRAKFVEKIKTHILRSVSFFSENRTIYEIKVKGKATPLKAWTGPEDSSSLRLPDFKTISI
jgi:hypothetical protein